MTHLVIIGGSDAGISAALRAKELAPEEDVTVLVADRFPNYSICGLPFYLSGEVPDWRTLAHRKTSELESRGITLRLDHRATRIDPAAKSVTATTAGGRVRIFRYDRLVVATGAVPARPSIEGLDLPGVFFLRSMADGFVLQHHLAANEPQSAVIVGSGYIGVEMADALTRRGLSVTVLARSTVLKTVDPSLGQLVRDELTRNKVKVVDGAPVTVIEKGRRGRLTVRTLAGDPIRADLILVAAGSQPESALAAAAGASTGAHGAVHVSRAMETNLPDVYAAGDCVETWHRLLGKNVYLPLGTTAHKQGGVAGENAVGGHVKFSGSLGTQVVKVFDVVAACTGLLDWEALEAGFSPRTAELESWDHKAYYPGATPLRLRLTADRATRVLLGAQILGHYSAEVSKRVDVVATAISSHMTVDDLVTLDLSYTPPTGSPWDPMQTCAQKWLGLAD
jgi:NADPH-dependent 2,4-dienoyl-CoA reductase/sulfur reductase-like enzyme